MNLEDWSPRALSWLEGSGDRDNASIGGEDLLLPSNEFAVGSLVATARHKSYDDYQVDMVVCYADKMTFGRMGLLILAAAFNPTQPILLQLTNPNTKLKTFAIEVLRNKSLEASEFSVALQSFDYSFTQPYRYPWRYLQLTPDDFPVFEFTNEQGFSVTPAEREERDLLRGPWRLTGSLRFAELLLNMSHPHCEQNEFDLECEAGYRGVGPASAELELLLPGSVGWQDFS